MSHTLLPVNAARQWTFRQTNILMLMAPPRSERSDLGRQGASWCVTRERDDRHMATNRHTDMFMSFYKNSNDCPFLVRTSGGNQLELLSFFVSIKYSFSCLYSTLPLLIFLYLTSSSVQDFLHPTLLSYLFLFLLAYVWSSRLTFQISWKNPFRFQGRTFLERLIKYI